MNQESEKGFPRYMYSDVFGKYLVILVQSYFLLLFKFLKKKKKKTSFFSEMQILSQKSDGLNRFLVKFPF